MILVLKGELKGELKWELKGTNEFALNCFVLSCAQRITSFFNFHRRLTSFLTSHCFTLFLIVTKLFVYLCKTE